MKKLVLITLLVFQCVSFTLAQAPAGAWIPVNAKWQKAPADINPNLSTASTHVLYFQPDGKMSVIGCVVNQQSGHYAISAGDGQTVAVGDWHEKNGQIVAHWRLVFRTVPKVGEKLPGPWVDEVLKSKDGRLVLKGVFYRRVPDLDKGAAELMPQPSPPNP